MSSSQLVDRDPLELYKGLRTLGRSRTTYLDKELFCKIWVICRIIDRNTKPSHSIVTKEMWHSTSLEVWWGKGWGGFIVGVNILRYKNRKIWSKESKSQDIYQKLLVKLYSFQARGTNSTWITAIRCLYPFSWWCRKWSFLARKTKQLWL